MQDSSRHPSDAPEPSASAPARQPVESPETQDAADKAKAEGSFTIRGAKDAEPKKSGVTSVVREVVILVCIALLLSFVLQNFVGRPYRIPSESMEDTLMGYSTCPAGHTCHDDRILVDKLTYHFRQPHPGDVVVFKAPNPQWTSTETAAPIRSSTPIIAGFQDVLSWFGLQPPNENDLVKRIIAVGGQTIECRVANGGITVDGKLIHEPYLSTAAQNAKKNGDVCMGMEFGPVTVPKGSYFMMGDNRTDSYDSRYHVSDGNQGAVPRKDFRGIVRSVFYPFNRIGGVAPINPQTAPAR